MDHFEPGQRDVLIIVDMQNDFIPQRPDLKIGGAFAVKDGDAIIPGIVDLVHRCHKKGTQVIYTRDYHPHDHVSFVQNGGPYPRHCLQGGTGSYIVKELAEASNADDIVVYKAFLPCIDSFGALPYSKDYAQDRITRAPPCSLFGTGAYALKCSGRGDRGARGSNDLNAPPDINSWKGPRKNNAESLLTILKTLSPKNIYVCGLTMEYCVLDTAVNLRQKKFHNVYILLDLTRAVAADPRFINDTIEKYGIKVIGGL